MTPILATKDLCKFYGSGENLIKAVDHVNLQIGQGEYVAIVGKSGSGKSTLLHLLGVLENPTSGEIWVDGKNIANLSEEKLASMRRRRIGFVFQAFNLIPSLNVWENIVLPIGLDGKKADDAFVRDILRTLDMAAKANALPNTLSGGQQQRTAIARAIAAKPSIILADEPTGDLDTKNSDEVISLLKLSAKKYGQTLVVITHNEDIAQMADRTIMLTTTLLMGLITSTIGSFDVTRQQAIAEGNHHAVITHLTEKQIEMLNNHLDVESLEAALQFATISYDNMDGYLTAGTTFKEGIYYGTGNLTEGHLPENPDEICGPPAFFERMDTEPVIGGKITVPFRVGGEGLIQTKEFTICGLVTQRDLSSLNVSEDRLVYSASVSEALVAQYLAPEEREYTAAIRLFGEERFTEDEMEEEIKSLCLSIGCNEENINYNLKYLMTMLSTSTEMRAAVLLVSGLILFFSALVIYSIYYVSVITDVQEIGKLKALGASKKQVKRLLVFESMRLCAIAVPPGLLLGFGIPALALPLIIKVWEKTSPLTYAVEHYHMFSLPAFFGVTIAVLLTVRISLQKPLRMAGKISPIEAIRYQESAAGAGARKGNRNVGLLQLSLANLLRNKKRTIVTMVTMGLSCVLFMSLAGTMNSMNAMDFARYAVPEGSFRLYLDCGWNDKEYPENNFDTLQQQNLFGEGLLQRILSIDGVTDIGKSGYVLFDVDFSAPLFENHTKRSIAPVSREETKDLQRDLMEGEIDYDKMLAENGVICTAYYDWPDMGLSIGEPVTLTIHDGNREIPLTVTVCAVIRNSMHGYFILPEELWDTLNLQFDPTCELHISIEQSKYDTVKAALQEIAEENDHFTLYSLDEELQLGSLSVNVIKYPLYMILIMVAVISCINLVNTMTTRIMNRRVHRESLIDRIRGGE